MQYETTTSPGQSGAGVFHKLSDDEYYVIGVLEAAEQLGKGRDVQITQERFDNYRNG